MSLSAKSIAPLKKATTTKKMVKESFQDENTNPNVGGAAVETKYQKLTQLEHILVRPDTYIGSIESQTQNLWVYDAEIGMTYRPVTFVPGLYKIFDEILVNAADNKQRDASMDTLKVTIDAEKNVISVFNNGSGISVRLHDEEQIYNPELIFGHLLTSSNYDDSQKKVTGGRNGYGAKLTNIFSSKFVVETADGKKRFKQVFTKNMNAKTEPAIEPCADNWTKITFSPDLPRFKMEELNADIVALMTKRVYDIAGCNPSLKVFFNGQRLPIKSFKDYVNLYLNSTSHEEGAVSGVFETVNDRWEVAFAVSDSGFQQVSFVNSICTIRGGTHVNSVADQVINRVIAQVAKKTKGQVKPSKVKNHVWLFVRALIENPAFDSQTKETLTTKASSFGSKCELSEMFLKTIVSKTTIMESVMDVFKNDQNKQLSKTDGKKTARITGMPKLEDANDAGTRYGKDCTLILTEGDSAKAFAVSGLSVVGRDRYGVFPLRGKLINPRDANAETVVKNEEIKALKTIIGLQQGHKYRDTSELRYGHVMIMTDQDPDGSHIKGLIINLFHHYWPELLKIPGFLVEFVTPIVKVTKGKQTKTFFTLQEYHQWKTGSSEGKGWTIKYYKGLGTSSALEAKTYFSDLNRHQIDFEWSGDGDNAMIDMAFSKGKCEERKTWLQNYDENEYIDHSQESVTYSEFINKELIHFSMLDNKRSIPSMVDGLKPGQRKILYCCFKRKLKSEVKVAQLVGYVSEHSAYHHGEQALAGTIVGLAQNFMGSNNINLLYPSGQFGTRLQGGKDSASPRYIFTKLTPITRCLFREPDDALLKYLNDDGQNIEPQWYIPIIPTVLVNGSEGIGTGWSSKIPNFNPRDIVDNIRRYLSGEELVPMQPWYRGFKGTTERNGVKGFVMTGTFNRLPNNTLEITELPPLSWTQGFKEHLDSLMATTGTAPGIVRSYKEFHTDTTVHFEIGLNGNLEEMSDAEIIKKFKLQMSVATTNMMLFDKDGVIKKYANAEEVIADFAGLRLEYYGLRKDQMVQVIRHDLNILDNRVRFINCVLKGELVVNNRKKAELMAQLHSMGFASIKISRKNITANNNSSNNGEESTEGSEIEDVEDDGQTQHYDYLLGMPIWSLTAEKVKDLTRDRDTKVQELNDLLSKTPEDLWNVDLDEFVAALDEHEADVAAMEGEGAAPKKKGGSTQRKKSAKRSNKKNSDDDDDDDDDFFDDDDDEFVVSKQKKKAAPAPKMVQTTLKPAAAAASTSVTSTQAKPKAAAQVKAKPSTTQVLKAPEEEERIPSLFERLARREVEDQEALKKSRPAFDDDKDDEDVAVVVVEPKKRANATKAAPQSKKPRISDESNDNDEEEAVPEKPKRAPRKAAPKKIVEPDSDEDDMDDDYMDEEERAPKPKKKASPPPPPAVAVVEKKVTKPRKKIVDDDDDDVAMMDNEEEVVPEKPKRAPRKAAPKKIVEPDSDEEEEEEEEENDYQPAKKKAAAPAPAPAPVRKAAAPKKSKKSFDDDDDDDDDDISEFDLDEDDDDFAEDSDDYEPTPVKKKGGSNGGGKGKSASSGIITITAAAKPKPKTSVTTTTTTIAKAAPKVSKPKATKKKLSDDDNDDDDDDFEAAAKPKVTKAPKKTAAATTTTTTTKAVKESKKETTTAAAAKPKVSVAASKPKGKSKKAASESDEDDDFDSMVAAAPRPARSTRTKAPIKYYDEDEDNDDSSISEMDASDYDD